MIAFHRVLYGALVAILFPRASAYATDRRTVAVAAFVETVEPVDEHLAFAAHKAVVLIGPRRLVATWRRKKQLPSERNGTN